MEAMVAARPLVRRALAARFSNPVRQAQAGLVVEAVAQVVDLADSVARMEEDLAGMAVRMASSTVR